MIDHRITYIISDINRAIAFEWIATRIREKFKLSFILLNQGESELETFLVNQNIPVSRVSIRGFRDYPSGIVRIYSILRKKIPDAIHCHLFHASIIGLAAGYLARVKRRIYTRHHSTYNWEYNLKGIWIDRLINWLSTDIVAISENVSQVLIDKEKVKLRKIQLIHHGFDLKNFMNVDPHSVNHLKKKYGINGRPVIGVVARWIEWKGIQYIIPAFSKLLEDYPDAFLVLANAAGPYKSEVEKLLNGLPADSYTVIHFENDLFALYHLFDIYVHTPINPRIEAFGQTYIEALAAGIPSIFTLSGIAPEFIKNEQNALVVPFCDSDAIYHSMCRLLSDDELKTRLVSKGRESVKIFSLQNMINKLRAVYFIAS